MVLDKQAKLDRLGWQDYLKSWRNVHDWEKE
jgi:hypothetical protein